MQTLRTKNKGNLWKIPMSESAKRHEENYNLIKDIRAPTDATIRNQGASIKTLEFQIEQTSKVLQERGFGSLPSSIETNLRDHVKSISTIVKANSYPIRRIGSSQYAVQRIKNKEKTAVSLHLSSNNQSNDATWKHMIRHNRSKLPGRRKEPAAVIGLEELASK
ncbi:hypothetical protein Tco_1337838 [Tanacetum coccineum]